MKIEDYQFQVDGYEFGEIPCLACGKVNNVIGKKDWVEYALCDKCWNKHVDDPCSRCGIKRSPEKSHFFWLDNDFNVKMKCEKCRSAEA
jgi:hypothetical protein